MPGVHKPFKYLAVITTSYVWR